MELSLEVDSELSRPVFAYKQSISTYLYQPIDSPERIICIFWRPQHIFIMNSMTASYNPSHEGHTGATPPKETGSMPYLTLNDGNSVPMVSPFVLLVEHHEVLV